MWKSIAVTVLRYRAFWLFLLIALTIGMGTQALKVHSNHEMHMTVPRDNLRYTDYQRFHELFGEEGNVLFIGVQSEQFFEPSIFRAWRKLGDDILQMPGIDQVLSPAHAFDLKADRKSGQFEAVPLPSGTSLSDSVLQQAAKTFLNRPFYDGLLYNRESNVYLMAVRFNEVDLNTGNRIELSANIRDVSEAARPGLGDAPLFYSGLPFIRSYKTNIMISEVKIFLILALIITMLILWALFRSIYAVVFPMLVIGSGIVISLGFMGLLGFEVNVLTGLIPTLLVVIGVPNCVYLLNKYHTEYLKHGNKIRALSAIIERIGFITFFANLTTAIGFLVFYATRVRVLQEFGVVAGLSISATFLLSIIAIPVIFSYLPNPRPGQTGHLEHKLFNRTIEGLLWVAFNAKKRVLAGSVLLFVVSAFGLTKLHSEGHILDDVPKKSDVFTDLHFLERNFNGLLPFEIMVSRLPSDSSEVDMTDYNSLRKIEKAQLVLAEYPQFSRSLSLVDGIKFARQSYYNGSARYYALPDPGRLSPNDRRFANMVGEVQTGAPGAEMLKNAFLDSSNRTARITAQVADIGSDSMPGLLASLEPRLLAIFPPEEFELTLTGTSILALEGYNYLVRGLLFSVGLAFLLISFIMAYLFRSPKMLFLALVPNLIPLMFTAAVMGYFSIPLKPSTVLTFGIAFGISVDFTIHFLAKYRQELYRHSFDIVSTIADSLRETGRSMMYTFLILLSGFIIFTGSKFEGTGNLGIFVSITLVIALFANLLLLPALLLIIERRNTHKRVLEGEPLMTVYDEEEDIALDKLDFSHERKITSEQQEV